MHAAALAAAVALTVGALPAAAADVDDLSGDPLRRGVLLALPSVWRVESVVVVPALRTRDGRLYPLPEGQGRVIRELGTAVAVSPDGVLVTAAHVAAPGGRALAVSAAPFALVRQGMIPTEDEVGDWVRREGVRPVGVRQRAIRVWRATPDGHGERLEVPARLLPGGLSRRDDLALLRVPLRGIASLRLDEALTSGTPVATIGYGSAAPFGGTAEGAPDPTVRTGALAVSVRVRRLPGQRFTAVTTRVQGGDSGGPAVDADGRVRGLVRFRDDRLGGIIERATQVRALLLRAGVDARPGRAAVAFRDGMTRYWALDAEGAARAFRETLRTDPTHPLAARQLDRAQTLRAEGVRLEAGDRRRGLYLGLALASLLAAAVCGAALLARPRPPRRAGGGGQGQTPRVGGGRAR
jgi:hypothetical protein